MINFDVSCIGVEGAPGDGGGADRAAEAVTRTGELAGEEEEEDDDEGYQDDDDDKDEEEERIGGRRRRKGFA